MSRSHLHPLPLLAILITTISATAAIIRVPDDQPTIAEAISVAFPGDIILVHPAEFDETLLIDYAGKAVRVEQDTQYGNQLTQPQDALYLMAPDSELTCPQGSLSLYGEVRSPSFGSASLLAGFVDFENGSTLTVLPSGRLDLLANQIYIDGSVNIDTDGVLWLSSEDPYFHADVIILDNGRLSTAGQLDSNGSLTAFNATITASHSINIADWWTVNGGRIICGHSINLDPNAITTLYATELTMSETSYIKGELRIHNGLVFADRIKVNSFYINDPQLLLLYDTELYASELETDTSGTIRGSGTWFSDLTNRGNTEVVANTSIDGMVHNFETGVITIYAGTLHFAGSLINDGTIIGDYTGPPARDDEPREVLISGDYSAGPAAGLFMPDATLRVDGQYDVAIEDPTRFDMSTATLVLGTLTGSQVSFELMGTDHGPDPVGLVPATPGNFPLGTLHIAGGNVNPVDIYDNDALGQDTAEALYVDTLRVDAGATLQNAGFNIYYNNLINDGTITDPTSVIPLPEFTTGDMNCDTFVNFDDINGFVLAVVGPDAYDAQYPGCRWLNADCNNDTLVTFDDIESFVEMLAGE